MRLSRLLRTTPLSDSKKTNNKEASNTLCRQVDELILLKVSYNHCQKHHNGQHEGRFHCVLKHIHQFHDLAFELRVFLLRSIRNPLHDPHRRILFGCLDCLFSTAKFEIVAIQNSDQVRNKDLIPMKKSIFYGGSRYKPTSFVRTWVIYN